jgi:ADP-heptose:LPS heptosyltransferase
MHLADALETPVVALYSGTDLEAQWRPRFTRHAILRHETVCYPCQLFDCPIGQPCLDIPASEVVATVAALCAEQVVANPARLEAIGD